MNPTPRRTPGRPMEPRKEHYFGHPTIGTLQTAVFIQPLTGARRTVQIVRYAGATIWKARIRETVSVVSRLGYQAEFVSPGAAKADITRFFIEQLGMLMLKQWIETPHEPRRPAKYPCQSIDGPAVRMIQ